MKRSVSVLIFVLILVPAAAMAQHQHGTPPPPSSGPPPLYPDLGSWTHKVTTSVSKAQHYFDQGLRLTYAFNHDEAIRAYREAARLDPKCAMAWWGVAYAAGPNINLPMDDAHAAIANQAIAKARALAPHASTAERAYIEALSVRYSTAPKASRAELDSGYAKAMRKLAARYPNDADAQVLYADAMLDLNPWNQGKHDGRPNPGTPEIVATLKSALNKWPNHPGANHYFIHTVEASPHPEDALPAAARLDQPLMPGAGHLVHMPAHIYARTGRYDDAFHVNQKAVAVDEKFIKEQKPEGVYPLMYYNHNIDFIWFAACMQGRSTDAIESARKVAGNVPLEVAKQFSMIEFIPPLPALTLTRFGRWDEVLKEPAPSPELRYSTALWHYARGLANAGKGDPSAAKVELDSVKAIAKAVPADMMISINYARPLLSVASHSLAGEIAAQQGKHDEAIRLLEEAVRAEDALHYDEPPTWPYPVRQRLGAVLLKAGRAAEAEAVYRADLKRHPENGWSLYGLAQSLQARGASKEAVAVEARFRKAWSRADVQLTASAF